MLKRCKSMSEYGEQAIKITLRASEITLRTLLAMCQEALARKDYPTQGEQSLKSLNAQGRQIESVDMDSADMKAFRRALRRYAVDFSVTREDRGGPYQVYFKAQDVDRVYLGLQKCLESFAGSKERKPIREIIEAATREARARQETREKTTVRARVADRERGERT